MANAIYPSGKQGFLSDLDLTTATLKVVLVDTAAYTYSANHSNLSDIPAPARVATSGALASKTVTGGVFDAADLTIPGFTGPTVEALVIYKDTGTASTSTLIAYIDTGGNLPYQPNTAQVDIAWDNTATKILAL
ncbi:hypothetical protein B4N89_27725 [Embleya scabrispora]|uniref:Uncharacterized protein n=1 Tax=Embleya scabrispora TaxID=159449 RepID=A0A1T3P575_9ACTN|nr:hypothetical protein [Embleya scabrispora]OPC84213.1 hypothetical protein B4N89_27725 [Embleya scabrispora]